MSSTSRRAKDRNSTLDGYTASTDDAAIASGTIGGIAYSAYLSNDSVDGVSNVTDSNKKVMLTTVATKI